MTARTTEVVSRRKASGSRCPSSIRPSAIAFVSHRKVDAPGQHRHRGPAWQPELQGGPCDPPARSRAVPDIGGAQRRPVDAQGAAITSGDCEHLEALPGDLSVPKERTSPPCCSRCKGRSRWSRRCSPRSDRRTGPRRPGTGFQPRLSAPALQGVEQRQVPPRRCVGTGAQRARRGLPEAAAQDVVAEIAGPWACRTAA